MVCTKARVNRKFVTRRTGLSAKTLKRRVPDKIIKKHVTESIRRQTCEQIIQVIENSDEFFRNVFFQRLNSPGVNQSKYKGIATFNEKVKPAVYHDRLAPLSQQQAKILHMAVDISL